MKKILSLAVCAVVLCGCANMQRKTTWSKQGEQPGDKSQAMLECDYDVSKAANNYDSSLRSSIGQGLELGMRQNALFDKCMTVRGWR